MEGALTTPYNGLWYDYATNTRILTLSGAKASTLQAALPIAITFVGAQVCSIIRLILYHLHYKRKPNTSSAQIDDFKGYLEQRRVLLRNSWGGLPLFFQLIPQVCHWRSFIRRHIPRDRGCRKATPLILIVCFVHFAAWVVFGFIVSFLWTEGYVAQEALVRSQNPCGTLSVNDVNDRLQRNLFEFTDNNATVAADQYVKQCYLDEPSATAPCAFYPQRRLDIKKSDGQCPFDVSQNCITTNSTPFTMDTEYIDSSDSLGMNAKPEDRILFRKLTTCSPISSRDYATVVNANETDEATLWPRDTRLYRYFYGNVPVNDTYNTSYTFEFSSWKPSDGYAYDLKYCPFFPSNIVAQLTSISANTFYGGADFQTWNPNASFWPSNRTNADVSIFFLNGDHVVYDYQTYDPLFVTGDSYTESVNRQQVIQYTPEFYTNVLACIDQYQICPANKDRQYCSVLSGIYQLGKDLINLNLNAAQLATAQRIVIQASSLSTYASVAGRRAAALLASLSVVQDTQVKALPIDQWRLEVAQWFATSLAKLQQGSIDFAVGPQDASLNQYVKQPVDPLLASQCYSQKIRLPSGSTNFHFGAIILILCIGVPLWLLGTLADCMAQSMLKVLHQEERNLSWTLDGTTQLQRLAYLAAGYGKWERVREELPVWKYDHLGPTPGIDTRGSNGPFIVHARPMIPMPPPPPVSGAVP